MARYNHNRQKLGVKPKANLAEKRTPFPTAIDGREWTVKEGDREAFISRTESGRVMQVPMGATDRERKVRLHEQAHVAFSLDDKGRPIEAPGVIPNDLDFNTVNAVEDSRISKLMANADPEWKRIVQEVDAWSNREWDAMSDMLSRRQQYEQTPWELNGKTPVPTYLEIARFIAATKGQSESRQVQDYVNGYGFEWLNEAVNELHRTHFGAESPTVNDTYEYARSLIQLMEEREEESKGEHESRMQEHLEEENDLEEADLNEIEPRYHNDDPNPRWGEMTIRKDIPLTKRMPAGMRSRKSRAFDEGSVPRNWHRYCTDSKVFGKKIRRKNDSGTILIDLSGSMHLSTEEVISILERWPGVLIATYSGADMRGELRVIARNGMRADDSIIAWTKGGNEVDGPALEWLAKEKEPRVWISDGFVCTSAGMQRSLLLDAARICKKGRIQRVENVRELIE